MGLERGGSVMVRKLGDRMLGAVLGRAEAGACVPRDYCYCSGGYKYYYNCFGVCTKSTSPC
jgi:hypothetical protein